MVKKTKISIGVSIGALVIIFVFRKPISRALFGATRFNLKTTNLAKKEWRAWDKGEAHETDSAMYDTLKRYWSNVGWDESRWTPTSQPWSASFISTIMKDGGAKGDFKYDSSHSVYIRDAIKNKKENNKNPFKGHRASDVRVRRGDIICYPRDGSNADYDTTSSYKSHCDLVVKVKKGFIKTIGGNVMNTVNVKEVKTDKKGKLIDSKYFVVIKNNK